MKTRIENNSTPSSKGMVVSAYMHNATGYILLNNNKVYCLETETSEDKNRLTEFIDQLQVGGYVFVYCLAHQKIARIYDMVSKLIFDCEMQEFEAEIKPDLRGVMRYKTKEHLPDGNIAYMFGIIDETEIKTFTVLVSPTNQVANYRKLVQLQAGDEIAIKISPNGIVSSIFDHTREFEITL